MDKIRSGCKIQKPQKACGRKYLYFTILKGWKKSTPRVEWGQLNFFFFFFWRRIKFLNNVDLLSTQFPFLEATIITSFTQNVYSKNIY